MSGSFHVEGAETVFRSHVFDVERRVVREGDRRFERDVAVHPGAVAVLAVNDAGEVGFIRQYRATFDREFYEIPAGTQDVPGEAPLETAKRELLEEIGYSAERWRLLGRFMNSPGWTNQVMTIFEARDLRRHERDPVGPEEQAATVHWFAPSAIEAALADQDAIDSTMMIALQLVLGDRRGWR